MLKPPSFAKHSVERRRFPGTARDLLSKSGRCARDPAPRTAQGAIEKVKRNQCKHLHLRQVQVSVQSVAKISLSELLSELQFFSEYNGTACNKQ